MTSRNTAPVGIIMGSQSDWETMRHAGEVLSELDIEFESRIVSAHRMTDRDSGRVHHLNLAADQLREFRHSISAAE